MKNIILLSDSYKLSHWKQYPKGTTKVLSYFESRGGKFEDLTFFGLQYLLKEYFQGNVVTREFIDEAKEVYSLHFGDENMFYQEGWEYILEKHNGKLPIEIKAVQEGTTMKTKNVLLTIENTDPKCFWLTNFLETLLVQLWYPSTVATLSRNIKKNILGYLEKTGNPSLIDFKLHDFGFRGASSVETAGIGGASHLINFKGSDTVHAISVIRKYYNTNMMPAFSIPASEHSTITSWGRENELEAYKNMLEQYPTGPVAIVSDSYDIFKACKEYWGDALKDKILSRDGVTIIRPDSSIPHEIVLTILNILGEKFGYTMNEKGYKVLPDQIRVIQGDGINHESINLICETIINSGWSVDNVTFGMGGALLQQINRDTQKFALKCSMIELEDGTTRDVFKDPITDQGKRSKKGKLKLIKTENGYETINHDGDDSNNLLKTVFLNGDIVKEYTFEEIIEQSKL